MLGWVLLLGGTAWGHFCCSRSGAMVRGSDLRHLYIESSFADLTCAAFAMLVPLRGLGGDFWKITIKTLHFSEYIAGGLFSAQSQESVAISRCQDTAVGMPFATLRPPWVCTQEMDECLSRVPQACLQALS